MASPFYSRLRFKCILVIFSISTSLCDGNTTAPVFNWDKLKPASCVTDDNYTWPDGEQVVVAIMLTINAVYDISEGKMEYGMKLQLVETWNDPIMVVPDEYYDLEDNKIVPQNILKCLWTPDTIFLNSKSSQLYMDTLPNRFTKLTFPMLMMYRWSRYRLTIACGMDFHLFPMDSQNCTMQISLRSEVAQILSANLLFVRSLTASLVNIYIPSTMIVSLSMVSFWLDVSAVPARVTLGVTAILTLSTQIVSARNSLPVLDYMTAMDIWLLGCMMMVFLSLIEFTCAQAWTRTVANNLQFVASEAKLSQVSSAKRYAWAIPYQIGFSKKRMQNKKRHSFDPRNIVKHLKNSNEGSKDKKLKKRDNYLDRVSRVLFPILMITFTTLYFWYYKKQTKIIESRIGEIIQH